MVQTRFGRTCVNHRRRTSFRPVCNVAFRTNESRRTSRKGTAALATPALHAGLLHLLRALLGLLHLSTGASVHLLLGALGGGRLAGRLIGSRSSLSKGGGGNNGGADGGGRQDRKNTHVWLLGSGASGWVKLSPHRLTGERRFVFHRRNTIFVLKTPPKRRGGPTWRSAGRNCDPAKPTLIPICSSDREQSD